jgi:heme-degrading monooxygenase HmoA
MIIVHDTFICKPGNASKMAKLFKEVMDGQPEMLHIMTDMTGQYNRVIMVSKYDSLTAYEQSWEKYKENTEEMKKMQEKMAGYHECTSLVQERFTRFGKMLIRNVANMILLLVSDLTSVVGVVSVMFPIILVLAIKSLTVA